MIRECDNRSVGLGAVWNWLRHGTPPGYQSCMIFQTNHLADATCMILKTKEMIFQDTQNARVMVSLELWGDTSLRPVGSVST